MKRERLYLDEYPIVIKGKNSNQTTPKIFFWGLLLVVVFESIFYIWFFTDYKPVFYFMLGIAWVAAVVQRRYKKDFENIDEKLSSNYSDPMIIITIASIIFALIPLVKLIDFYPNSGWWWVVAGFISFFFPSYPDTDFQKRP